jgi:hypothetical protein
MSKRLVAMLVALGLVAAALIWLNLDGEEPLPTFEAQACGLGPEVLERLQRGLTPAADTLVAIPRRPFHWRLPGGPATQGLSGTGAEERVPLVFYGPGVVPARGEVEARATLADVAPTLGTFLRGAVTTADGNSIDEVVSLESSIARPPPKLIVTVVWQGAGWNLLREWPGSWDNLLHLVENGVSLSGAIVGHLPVGGAPALITLGTGAYPRSEERSLAARWQSAKDGRARVGLVGTEEHLDTLLKGTQRVRSGSMSELIRAGFGADEETDLIFEVAGGIAEAAASDGPSSEAVFDAIQRQDRRLGQTLELLNDRVGRGNYVVVFTADGGVWPDAVASDQAVAAGPQRLQDLIETEFGDVVREVRPTELDVDASTNATEVARFLQRVDPGDLVAEDARETGSASFFALAAPSDVVARVDCGARPLG